MLKGSEVLKLVCFDIETAAKYETFDELQSKEPELAKHWEKRANWWQQREEQFKSQSVSELYPRAALQAEYGKIICISLGQIKMDDSLPVLNVKSFTGDEQHILTQFKTVVESVEKLNLFKFCGHNIFNFDIPFIAKRMIANEITPPKSFIMHNQKPWESMFLDTSKVWGSGSYAEQYTSLDLLTYTLNIPSPKKDMKGEDVHEYYHSDMHDEIVTYCENDVKAVANVCLKMANMNTIE